MDVKEGYIDFEGYQTYYRIVNPEGHKTPLLLLHGGPGSTHNSFELLDHVAFDDDRPLIMYDQIGCGNSSIPENHPELWVKETWVRELENLRAKLDLREIHLMGHSWGGMLAIIYLCDKQPMGIKSVNLSSTLSSASLWEQEARRLIKLLDPDTEMILLEAQETDSWDEPAVKSAINEYYHRYVFGPFDENTPECITRKKPNAFESYVTAWGRSEFAPSGTLKDYEYTDKLNMITCPVMLISGASDESTPLQNKVMYDAITADKRWHICPSSNHLTYYYEHELYVKYLTEFLNEIDGR